jgi:hypothetical protein
MTPHKHAQDRIEHSIQVLAYLLGKKAQHEVAVLLQQLVLPPIATVRDRIREVLSAIEFDRQTSVSAQQVDFERSQAVERNWQHHVDAEASTGLCERIQSAVEERLGCTSRPRCALGVFRHCARSVHEQARQRPIDAVPNDQPYAAGVIAFPDGIGWKNDVSGPPQHGAGGKEDRVADSLIPATSPVKHSCQHRYVEVGVVVDSHLALPVVETMQPAGILRDCPSPRDRKRQKQGVQTRIVESLAHVLASRKDDSPFMARNGGETLIDCLSLLLANAGAQDDNVFDARRERLLEAVEVLISLRQD